jgi:hypothetical protein
MQALRAQHTLPLTKSEFLFADVYEPRDFSGLQIYKNAVVLIQENNLLQIHFILPAFVSILDVGIEMSMPVISHGN